MANEPAAPRPVLAMRRLKYILAMVVLAGWFAEAFVSDKFLHFASATLYSLAILILALSARSTRNADPTVRFGTKYLLCGLPAVAAIISVGAVIVDLKRRNFCTIIDCFSLNGFLRFHAPEFVSDFAAISLRFYTIVFLSIFLPRMIKKIPKGEADGRIFAKRERSEKRDT
jgi:hypothetical protein